MNLKTVNKIFGYGFFGIGAIRIIYIILLFSQMVTNVNIALNGGEWSYGKKNEQNEYISEKKQKRMEKLEKELEEWKQLLDTGEIDEETYNQETSRLIEKERKRSERDK